jgi:catechol 2,3-dioxygenase-like lactoylglutathione lyase family enzyme
MAGKTQIATLVPIRNMNRAIKFYTKKLGGKLKERAPGKMKDMWASVHLHGSDLWLIMPPTREKRKLAYSTFVVPDIRRFVSGLTRKGVQFDKAERMGPDSQIEGPIAFESFGASAFFKDSEGNMWMAWQNTPAM